MAATAVPHLTLALGCLNIVALGCLNIVALGCLNIVALDYFNAIIHPKSFLNQLESLVQYPRNANLSPVVLVNYITLLVNFLAEEGVLPFFGSNHLKPLSLLVFSLSLSVLAT